MLRSVEAASIRAVRRLLRRLGNRLWFAWVGSRTLHHVDLFAERLTGRTLVEWLFPTLMLTTVGRTTRLERRVPLLYASARDGYIVAATNWGQARHPGWSANLLATPEARVRVGRREGPVRARLLEGEERERAWAKLTEVWPAYDAYRERASHRRIRVFALERIR